MLMHFHDMLSFAWHLVYIWEDTCKQTASEYMCEFKGLQLSLLAVTLGNLPHRNVGPEIISIINM